MTEILTTEKNKTETASRHIDFQVTDSRGRTIGVSVRTWEVDMVPVPEGQQWGWRYAPGHYFFGLVQVTRNGKTYGASQPRVVESTQEAREAAIEKKIASARRTALKNAAAPKLVK